MSIYNIKYHKFHNSCNDYTEESTTIQKKKKKKSRKTHIQKRRDEKSNVNPS